MKNRLKVLIALAASLAAIAIGQRAQNDAKPKEPKTQRAEVEGVDDAETWFI
ncbi:MAG: hypothetical protein OEU54_02375 [Gemmatimonadota bacterium]|nr:hypothetical protein [Gemmatimonadota bacterium]